MAFTFRPLDPKSAASDAMLVHAVMKEGGAPGLPLWSPEQIASSLENGHSFAAFGDQGLLAFLLVHNLAGAFEIVHLATASAARRQGVMRGLFTVWLATLPADCEVWLEVHEANNAAQQLYRGFGFRESGRRPKYYADGGAAVLYNLG